MKMKMEMKRMSFEYGPSAIAKSAMILRFLFALLICATAARAVEQTVTYRIVGLSAPERKGDFAPVIAMIPELKLVSYDFDHNSCTLSFDPEQIIPPGPPKKKVDRSPEALLEKINVLLKKASSKTFSLTPPSTISPEKLSKVEIKVGLLDCKGCRFCVYDAVSHLDGVDHASVAGDTLTAWIDATKVDQAALEDALIKDKVVVPGNPKSLPAWK